jgi:hypothetical protein
MSRLWTAAVAVVAAAALFLSWARPGTAQPTSAAPLHPGRYQMQVLGGNSVSTVFVLDTHTGQTWYRTTHYNDKAWSDMGSPKTLPAAKGPE